MLRLVVTAGNQRGKVFDLPDARGYVLGRGDAADIAFLDIAASRRHAEISVEDVEQALINDLGSTNGTTLNGREVRRSLLADGDRLVLGETEMLVSFSADAAIPPTSRTTLADTGTDVTEFMGALIFCEGCNESILIVDVDQGRAAEIDGKLYCARCLKELSDAKEN